jgi:hypothetical protein
MEEQRTLVLARAVDIITLIRYVKGDTRYMKIQKRGSCEGVARTLRR